MTPLLFISIVIVVLTMLFYWVLDTAEKDTQSKRNSSFAFEAAPELAPQFADAFYLARNTMRIKHSHDDYGLVYWNLERARWEEICAQNQINPDMRRIFLRINETGIQYHYNDMWVGTIAGESRFLLEPQKAYYATLGIKLHQRFIPILNSSTIMLHDI